MNKIFDNDWQDLLQEEFEKSYYQNLRKYLIKEYSTKTIYPDKYDIFNALKLTSYSDVKVVILGLRDQITLMDYPFLLKKELKFLLH